MSIETGGAATFASLTGTPADNAALAVALAAKTDKAGDTMTGGLVIEAHGASGSPALHLSGTPFTGGTGTTTKPLMLVEPAGTTSHAWNASGTMLGVNAASGFAGNLMDLKHNEVSVLSVNSSGAHIGMPGVAGYESTIKSNWGSLYVNNAVTTNHDGQLCFSAINGSGTVSFFALHHDSVADTVAIRRGAAAQTMRWYRTHTDASNYERAAIQSGAGYFELAAETAGSGSDNLDIRITPAGAGAVIISSLPTTNPGPGILWNNGGTPAIGT